MGIWGEPQMGSRGKAQVKAGASILGLEGRDPQILVKGCRGGRRGSWRSWTGREILLYLIMYRKYV